MCAAVIDPPHFLPIRYIAYLAGAAASEEVAFARAKIDANFSNYSAWHHRSSVLRQAQAQQQRGDTSANDDLAARCAGPLCAPALGDADRGQPLACDVLSSEFELVTQAFYTEPEDQAAWFYHDWLLDQALESTRCAGSSGVTWQMARELLCGQADTCRALRELEPSCRWPGLTLVRVLRAIMRGDVECAGGSGSTEGLPNQRGDALQEARDVLAAVAGVDPMRRGFYDDLRTELEGAA
jgi:geranylgeranyl transferase type-2 subunit alpha